MRLQCEAECATRVKCNRPHISIRLAPPATMEDAVALCHAEKLTITDEAAPQVDAALMKRLRAWPRMQHSDCDCALRDANDLLRDLLAAVTPAPSPDAALDEATVAAAEAWGVGIQQVYVVPAELDAYGAWARVSGEMSKWAYGPTRLAALAALAALPAPKLKRVEDMSVREMMYEAADRLGLDWPGDETCGWLHAPDVLRALRDRDGVHETGKDETP